MTSRTKNNTDPVDVFRHAIEASGLPDSIKQAVGVNAAALSGKITNLLTQANGAFSFFIRDQSVYLMTGNHSADALVQVLLLAFQKQSTVLVFYDPATRQVTAATLY
ncbi:MAG TPA: hypothetical protein P5307_01815 [Pirellulaceae bacterium]|nr:hypothetical protein [Planctomycetaceae bacterium]HRX77763.1 hypothetical protein [Pirellulaceae bacterium]